VLLKTEGIEDMDLSADSLYLVTISKVNFSATSDTMAINNSNEPASDNNTGSIIHQEIAIWDWTSNTEKPLFVLTIKDADYQTCVR
jgi:hypothetical protein